MRRSSAASDADRVTLTPEVRTRVQTTAAPQSSRRCGPEIASGAGSLARFGRALGIGAAVVGAGLLAGCGHSLTSAQLGAPVPALTQSQDQQQAMHFEVVPNSVRVDVIRQTHTETHCTDDGHGNEDCTTETVKDPYQPMGIYLGRGLFLDAGMNLSVVPDRLYHGPLIPQDFSRLQIQGPFGSWSRANAVQQGNTVGVSQSLTFFDNSFIRDNPDQVTMKFGTFKPLQKYATVTIKRHGNETDIQAWAPDVKILQAMQRVEIRDNGSTVEVHPFGPKGLVNTKITYTPDKVTVQPFGGHFSRTDIEKKSDGEIDVSHWGPGGMSTARGQAGMNETASLFGFHSRANITINGNRCDVNEPGLFGHSVITVEPGDAAQ
jgi:hypothetical protein